MFLFDFENFSFHLSDYFILAMFRVWIFIHFLGFSSTLVVSSKLSNNNNGL